MQYWNRSWFSCLYHLDLWNGIITILSLWLTTFPELLFFSVETFNIMLCFLLVYMWKINETCFFFSSNNKKYYYYCYHDHDQRKLWIMKRKDIEKNVILFFMSSLWTFLLVVYTFLVNLVPICTKNLSHNYSYIMQMYSCVKLFPLRDHII